MGKEDRIVRKNKRLKRKISRQEAKIVESTPTAKKITNNKSNSSVGSITFANNSGSSGSGNTKSKKGTSLQDCKDGKCDDSKTSSGQDRVITKFNPNKSKHNLNTNSSNFNKRKRAQKKINKYESKITKPKYNGKGPTPRTLKTGGFLEPGTENIFD